MKKLLVLVVPLALAACNTNVATQFDVSGTISPAPAGDGAVRLALVGVGTSGVANENPNQTSINLGDNGTKFTVDLPDNLGSGVYSFIAYRDKNGNNKYDLGEVRTAVNLSQLLTYDKGSNTWKQGNTVLREAGKSVSRTNTYNLSW